MRDDSNRRSQPAHAHRDDLDDQINQLTPVPNRASAHHHQRMEGPIDTLLPSPGESAHPADDATTYEELEVDTTVDGVDDIIDPAPRWPHGEPHDS